MDNNNNPAENDDAPSGSEKLLSDVNYVALANMEPAATVASCHSTSADDSSSKWQEISSAILPPNSQNTLTSNATCSTFESNNLIPKSPCNNVTEDHNSISNSSDEEDFSDTGSSTTDMCSSEEGDIMNFDLTTSQTIATTVHGLHGSNKDHSIALSSTDSLYTYTLPPCHFSTSEFSHHFIESNVQTQDSLKRKRLNTDSVFEAKKLCLQQPVVVSNPHKDQTNYSVFPNITKLPPRSDSTINSMSEFQADRNPYGLHDIWDPPQRNEFSIKFHEHGSDTWCTTGKPPASPAKNHPTQIIMVPALKQSPNDPLLKWTQSGKVPDKETGFSGVFLPPNSSQSIDQVVAIEKSNSGNNENDSGIDISNSSYTASQRHLTRSLSQPTDPMYYHHSVNKTGEHIPSHGSLQSHPSSSCGQLQRMSSDSSYFRSNLVSSLIQPHHQSSLTLHPSFAVPYSDFSDFPAHLAPENVVSQNNHNFAVFPRSLCANRTYDIKDALTYNLFVKALPDHISPNDVFCMVPGRLGMPNQGKKHEVLVGEILRRVLTPESLNISLLGPILRKAKSKNGSQYLRQKLHQIGVELPQGRRKTAQCTLFTSLTESESGQLAEDFNKLCELDFPARTLARRAPLRIKSPAFINPNPQSIQYTLQMISGFMELLSVKDLTNLSEEGGIVGNEESMRQLYNFETLTHGFGIKALIASLKTFRTFVHSFSEVLSSDS